ncbi:hypothetical protein NEOC65_000515 [Neochlamydia sp. AcF65]|nr:hypothetical protein [Neochlamydia sp. AcF65]MBS4170172.1 hypothetical protein [Neochlamydia sp. AcF95]
MNNIEIKEKRFFILQTRPFLTLANLGNQALYKAFLYLFFNFFLFYRAL